MYTPPPIKRIVDAKGCVVGVKYNLVLNDIICWIPRIEIPTDAVENPHRRWAFLPINHPSSIGIGVSPIGTCDILNTVWNAITIGIDGVLVIPGVILWIGAIEIFLAIPNTTCICIGIEIIRHIRIGTTVANDSGDEIQ